MLKKLYIGIIAAGLAFLLCSCSVIPILNIPERNWKMSVVTSEDSSWAQGASLFADLVKKNSGGKMQITVYPNGTLAGGDQVKELTMLQEGSIDFTYHSNLLYSNLDPSFAAISMPWLFTDYLQLDSALSGSAGKQLLKAAGDQRIMALAFGENGFRQLTNNRRPVSTPDDLKGLKIRIPGVPLYSSIYNSLGAQPLALNFSEVPAALQDGRIDGQENPVDIIVSSKLYDIQKYITIWNYSYDAIILGMNKQQWDDLPFNARSIISKAARDATRQQVLISRNAAITHLDLLHQKGMTVTELTPEQVQVFKNSVEPVYTEWSAKIGPSIKQLRKY